MSFGFPDWKWSRGQRWPGSISDEVTLDIKAYYCRRWLSKAWRLRVPPLARSPLCLRPARFLMSKLTCKSKSRP